MVESRHVSSPCPGEGPHQEPHNQYVNSEHRGLDVECGMQFQQHCLRYHASHGRQVNRSLLGSELCTANIALSAFGKRFGSFDPVSQIYTLTPLQLALFNSLDVFTDILVTVAVRYLAERLGRRFVAGFIITFLLLGFAVAYTSQTFAQIMIGRLFYTSAFSLNGSMMTMAMAEILPGAIRGKMISMNSILYNCGTIVAAGLSSVTSRIEDDRAWQYMLVSGIPCTAISIFVLCFIPESPRWLLRMGRKEDARRVLQYIHGSRSDYDAAVEVELLNESLQESEKSSDGKWKDLLHAANKVSPNTPSNLAACFSTFVVRLN